MRRLRQRRQKRAESNVGEQGCGVRAHNDTCNSRSEIVMMEPSMKIDRCIRLSPAVQYRCAQLDLKKKKSARDTQAKQREGAKAGEEAYATQDS